MYSMVSSHGGGSSSKSSAGRNRPQYQQSASGSGGQSSSGGPSCTRQQSGQQLLHQQPGTADGETGVVGSGNRPKGLPRRLYAYLKQYWTGVKFRKDSCYELSDASPIYRPKGGLPGMASTTRFSKEELKHLYQGFKAQCPEGIAKEDTFKEIYARFFPPGVNSGQYAHHLFRCLDHDQKGEVNFEDFAAAMSILSRGSLNERLRWVFQLYDQDGDGRISRAEFLTMAVAVFALMGPYARPPIHEQAIMGQINAAFKKLDLNEDGYISEEEFISSCLNDDVIMDSLTVIKDSLVDI